jgi:hypothetical protein
MNRFWVCATVVVCALYASISHATPLITALTQNGTGLNAAAPLVTSVSNRLPQPEGAGTQGALGDEAFVFVTRHHEWTAVRTDPATGVLATANTNTLQPFPSYLIGLEYVQFPNENRAVTDYSVDLTFAEPVTAYLFVDNRVNGAASGTKGSTTDPTLVGNVVWIANDGWTRVNTGFMPNGQPDYLGSDEGTGNIASADLRSHTATNLIAGSGNGLNNFFAIYSKTFPAGLNTGVTKAYGNGSPNFYGLAVAPVPEPGTVALAVVGAMGMTLFIRRRSR